MADAPPPRPRDPDPVRALEWTAAVEDMSRVLRRPLLKRLRTEREYETDDRVASAVSFRGSDLFTDPATQAPIVLDPQTAMRVRSPATADVVLAGAMRTRRLLRFRAFYMRSRRTLAVQRRDGSTPMPLVAGTRLQAEVRGRVGFAVPRVYDSGFLRPQKADWTVEEVLRGTHVARGDAAATAREVISLLPDLWQRSEIGLAVADREQRAQALTAFQDLVDDPLDGIWPKDVDRQAAARRVRSLLEEDRSLLMGLSHGDPGLGNVLRLDDGRLGLIDWEYAGHRAVAHDVMKVILSSPDPAGLAATLPEPPRGASAGAPHVMAWRRQVATSIVLFLRSWRYRHMRAVKRYSASSSRRRMHMTVRTLDVLLDD